MKRIFYTLVIVLTVSAHGQTRPNLIATSIFKWFDSNDRPLLHSHKKTSPPVGANADTDLMILDSMKTFVGFGAFKFMPQWTDDIADIVTPSIKVSPLRMRAVLQAVAGSTIAASSLNSVINPTMAPYNTGADIGAWINAAVASLGKTGGRISIPSSLRCYSYKTPIVISSNIALDGVSPSTCLEYTPTSGTAMSLSGSNIEASRIRLIGTSGTSTATGLAIIGPAINVSHFTIGGGAAQKFHTGLTFGDNSFLDFFDDIQVQFNDQNALFPAGLANAGENISFASSVFGNGGTYANCFQNGSPGVIGGGEIEFTDVSFDSCQLVNNEGIVKMSGTHFEDGNVAADYPFVITYSSSLTGHTGDKGTLLYGTSVQMNANPNGTALFEVDRSGQLTIDGLRINGTPNIPLVRLGKAAGDSPFLSFTDNANNFAAPTIYSIFPGAFPVWNIDTQQLKESSSSTSYTFARANPSTPYGKNAAINMNASSLGIYKWSGSGTRWYGQQFQINGFGDGFDVCTAAVFTFGGYSAFGSETETCGGTHLGNNYINTVTYRAGGSPGASFTETEPNCTKVYKGGIVVSHSGPACP